MGVGVHGRIRRVAHGRRCGRVVPRLSRAGDAGWSPISTHIAHAAVQSDSEAFGPPLSERFRRGRHESEHFDPARPSTRPLVTPAGRWASRAERSMPQTPGCDSTGRQIVRQRDWDQRPAGDRAATPRTWPPSSVGRDGWPRRWRRTRPRCRRRRRLRDRHRQGRQGCGRGGGPGRSLRHGAARCRLLRRRGRGRARADGSQGGRGPR